MNGETGKDRVNDSTDCRMGLWRKGDVDEQENAGREKKGVGRRR